jgi:hypothetical protein
MTPPDDANNEVLRIKDIVNLGNSRESVTYISAV